jgi:hypothetical protein
LCLELLTVFTSVIRECVSGKYCWKQVREYPYHPVLSSTFCNSSLRCLAPAHVTHASGSGFCFPCSNSSIIPMFFSLFWFSNPLGFCYIVTLLLLKNVLTIPCTKTSSDPRHISIRTIKDWRKCFCPFLYSQYDSIPLALRNKESG